MTKCIPERQKAVEDEIVWNNNDIYKYAIQSLDVYICCYGYRFLQGYGD